jgi:hypothetical protein
MFAPQTPDAEHGGSAPTRICPSSTCADATRKTTPIDPLKEVVVKIGSKKVADVKGLRR